MGIALVKFGMVLLVVGLCLSIPTAIIEIGFYGLLPHYAWWPLMFAAIGVPFALVGMLMDTVFDL